MTLAITKLLLTALMYLTPGYVEIHYQNDINEYLEYDDRAQMHPKMSAHDYCLKYLEGIDIGSDFTICLTSEEDAGAI